MTTPGGATDVTASDWINWAQRVAAIAQNGLTFTRDPYDRERYEQLRSIAAEIMSRGSGHTLDTIR
jgi:hypothetical protein